MSGDPPGLASRHAAYEAVAAVEDRGAFSNLTVPHVVGALDDPRDRGLASHLAYETLRWRGTLDWALEVVLDRPVAEVEAALRHVLRLGAVQLLVSSGIPDRAAVSTSAELARRVVRGGRAEGAVRFVNGVLRNLARRRRALPWPDPGDTVDHLTLSTAHPSWQVTELVERLGAEGAAAALTADNEAPGLTLRAAGDRDALVEELRGGGVTAAPGRLAPEAVRAPGADPRELPAVREGRAHPQDEASMLAARATGAAPGARVLDLCAGPGGKATHLAALVGPAGRVTAVELHRARAELIEQAAAAQGLDVDVVVGDALEVELDDGYDAVLVDAPCTDLGAGRRRPEVRWRRTPQDVTELARLQARLLARGAELVGPGGRLVYAVCTWTAAETDAVVDRVAADERALELLERRQYWPHRDATDAMFVAALSRV